MKYFIAGSTAPTAAVLAGIHRNSAIRFFHKLREKIAIKQQNRSEQFAVKIEIDESYFTLNIFDFFSMSCPGSGSGIKQKGICESSTASQKRTSICS